MMSEKVFSCHKISEGVGEGEVIISKDEIMFYLVRPETGEVFEKAHDIEGESVAKKALIFPGGKGSSVVQSDGLYQLMMRKNQPVAMIIQNAETVLVASAIIMEIPMVDKVDPDFYKTVKNGDRIRVDANNGTITILD
jgi:predicted aconitase with swiveling domain